MFCTERSEERPTVTKGISDILEEDKKHIKQTNKQANFKKT